MEDQTHNTLRPLEDIVARNEFLVSRYDHYYDSVNNKGMFYLTFNSFLLSGICGSYIALKAIINASVTLHSLVIILFVTTVLSSVYTILSINPFLKKCISSSNTFYSLMFFGDVAKKSNEEFIQKTLHRSEMDHCIDLLTQTHTLATGLNKKFERLVTAGNLILVELILFIIIIPLIVYNLK